LSVKKGSLSSQSTCPQGPLALQIYNAGPSDSSSAALLLREHAKTAREKSAINGQGHAKPARGQHRPIHQQPRHRWALSSTAELALRPPTCGCSTGPRTSRPRHHAQCRVQAHSTLPFRAPELPCAPQNHRSRPRDKQETRQRAEQRTTKGCSHHSKQVRRPPYLPLLSSEDYCGGRPDVPDSLEVPHCTVCLGSDRHLGPFVPLFCCSAERRQPAFHHDAQLLYQRCAARRSSHPHGKTKTAVVSARAGQTKQPLKRAPPPSSQGRAAAAAPAPRAAVNGPGGSDLSKWLAQLPVSSWTYVIWNCRIYIWIRLQSGKLPYICRSA